MVDVSICYFGVVLLVYLPEGGGRINCNTTTKGGIKCLLPLIGCCINCRLCIPKQGDARETCANAYPSS